MSVSEFHTVLILERQKARDDDSLDVEREWVRMSSAMARITPRTATERLDVAQMANIHDFDIRVRYNGVIRENDRWFDPSADRYFTIYSVSHLDRDLKTEGHYWTSMRCTLWPTHSRTS